MKPDLVQIFYHANPKVFWYYAPTWIYTQYNEFRIEKGYPMPPNPSVNVNSPEFVDWLLEKYWPDWEENSNE